MNSAAVIGRQLRQQQTATGRTSGPLVPPSPHRTARPKTPSHQPHQPQQQLPSPPAAGTTSVYTIQSATQNLKDPYQQQQQHKQKDQNQKKKGIDKMKSCISFRCIWLCCKSLSGGVLMIAIGVGMTVFGFYADTFAVHDEYQESTNKTVEVIDEDLKYHIHNLSFVGPVFMGLGGMLIVAACVLIYDTESSSRVAPIKARRPSDGDITLTEHLINPQQDCPVIKSERLNGPISPFLPNHAGTLLPGPVLLNPVPDKGRDMKTIAEVQVLQPGILPNGPSRGKRPQLPLPVRQATSPPSETTTTLTHPSTSTLSSPFPNPMISRTTLNRRKRHFLSPLFDEFVPSPQDIQILDPDGCTPDSSLSLEMDVYVTKCPRTMRVQLEPRYLASIESDGLSDSDTAESEFTTGGSSSILSGSSRIGGVKGRFCSPCEIEEQDMPLLGRCSPPSSPEYPLEPLLKRDRIGLRRFPILRHPAALHHNSRMLFDGPSDGNAR